MNTVITMDGNHDKKQSSAILVEDGLISAVGDQESLEKLAPNARLDTSFENEVVVPGLIDPHIHMILGALIYSRPFIPPWDMPTPDGLVKAAENKVAFLERLAELNEEHANDDPLIVYGYHNLVHGDIYKSDLDKISSGRPIFVWHYSAHDFYLNSAALTWSEITAETANEVEGIDLDDEGELTGRIYEHAALYLFKSLASELLTPGNIAKGWNGFEKLLMQSGVTSIAELGYGLFGKNMEDLYYTLEYTKDDNYHLYLVPEHRAFYKKYGDESPQVILEMASEETERGDPVILPQVKFFTDVYEHS